MAARMSRALAFSPLAGASPACEDQRNSPFAMAQTIVSIMEKHANFFMVQRVQSTARLSGGP